MNLEAPNTLPNGIQHLSHSSVDQYLRCPEKWRRRYIERDYEPRVGHLILGGAVHSAEQQSYSDQITSGEPHPLERVMDEYATALDREVNSTTSEIDWGEFTAGTAKDRGARLLEDYHTHIPRLIKPKKTETQFNIRLNPSYEWTILGYVDIIGDIDNAFEVTEDVPQDLKTVKRAINDDDMANSTQATLYTYSQMLEDPELEEMPFVVHELKATKTTTTSRLIDTYRTRAQGERYMERVAAVAREIEWRMQSGEWQGAPPAAWWCRQSSCGYYNTCKFAAGRP